MLCNNWTSVSLGIWLVMVVIRAQQMLEPSLKGIVELGIREQIVGVGGLILHKLNLLMTFFNSMDSSSEWKITFLLPPPSQCDQHNLVCQHALKGM